MNNKELIIDTNILIYCKNKIIDLISFLEYQGFTPLIFLETINELKNKNYKLYLYIEKILKYNIIIEYPLQSTLDDKIINSKYNTIFTLDKLLQKRCCAIGKEVYSCYNLKHGFKLRKIPTNINI